MYRAVYEILAGEIDERDSAASQLSIWNKLDWKRTFAMRLWFSVPVDGSIKDAVQEYWMACQQDSTISKPRPWYDTHMSDNLYDGLFQLLKLYSGTGVNSTLDDVSNPLNFTSSSMDVRIPWHLYIILSQLIHKFTFSDAYGTKEGYISDTGEKLTVSYITQLEHQGLWQWAIFIALHLQRHDTRKGIILDLLARYIPTIPTPIEEQGIISKLIEQWKLPQEWILEAKVVSL